MKDISNTQRVMKIRDILYENTDEEHEMSLKEIANQLKSYLGNEFTPSKNTIKKNIEELRESGFNIEERIGEGKTVFYRHQYRKFEIHELRMLVDSVSSARFISAKETKQLVQKIESLASKHQAKKLHHQITVDASVKAQNPEVRYHIDKIHTAINEQKRLTFQYGNFNVKKEFVLRHQGKVYSVIPLALVWSNDYYYFVAKDHPESDVKHYRVDRMKMAQVTNFSFTKSNFNIAEHLQRSFNMYPGEEEHIEIQFNNQLVNVVIDRFGKDIIIREMDNQTFSIKFKAAVSEGLIRWLLSWGSDAKVNSPQNLVEKMKEEAKKMNDLYK